MRKRMDGWRRIGVAGVVGAVALLALGDSGRTQVAPGGQDPLEILNLQVRANAIIVLDSSGSMSEDPITNPALPNALSGDTRFSKLYQAKQVLSRVIAANETKVSFQFGRYTQPFAAMTLNDTPLAGTVPPANPDRFHYATTNTLSPGMTTGTIVDLRSYVVPVGAIINLQEPTGGATVAIPIPAGRYASGMMLATAIQTALALDLRPNTYTVTYLANHRFEFRRTGGANTFTLRWPTSTAALRTELGFNNADDTGGTVYTSDGTAQGDIDLIRSNSATDNPNDGTTQYYRAYSRKYFNGQVMSLLPDGRVCSVLAGPPGTQDVFDPFNPAVLPPNVPLPNAPYIILETRATCAQVLPTQTIRMEFGGAVTWNGATGGVTCGGFQSLIPLQPCTNNAQFSLIADHLQPELRINTTTGAILGYTESAAGDIATAPTAGGIRASGNTPIAESLEDLKTIWNALWAGTISTQTPRPRTFAIILTDGDDTCDTATTTAGASDNLALRAAYRAQLLYAPIVAGDPASGVTTFVVAFGAGVSANRANWIAWGGSGMVRPTTGGGDPQRWTSAPADKSGCPTCKDAFVAGSAQALIDALQAAIDQGQSAGEFSDQQSITESVFELISAVPAPPLPAPHPNPLDPTLRYNTRLPVLLQSTFTMPDFEGNLKAFRNVAGVGVPLWNAAQKLQDRVEVVSGVPGAPAPWINRTFAQLHGSANYTNIGTVALTAGGPHIRRRIFSTNRNGVFLTGSDAVIVGNLVNATPFVPPGQIALWPPDPSIDPVNYLTPGPLDVALGLFPDPTTVPPQTPADFLLELQTTFGACTPSTATSLPTQCQTGTGLATKLPFAVKEARQIILAHAAGAALVKNGVNAVRQGVCAPPNHATANCLVFEPRQWVMAESTLAASAVVTPPLQSLPQDHNPEYKMFRDGPRTPANVSANGFASGFGLRNPDLDTNPAVSQLNANLKPVMSVIYHGTNHMVHAFRAGPCPATPFPAGPPACVSGPAEGGGEELWAFVPFDQLSKLGERVKPQLRNPHTYVVATPIRVTDIFVPGNFGPMAIGGASVSGSGVWRTVILFGRGIAGKHLTAIDVTNPLRFNESTLSSAMRPPIVMWSRGNPDTQSGSPTGVDYNNTTGAGSSDFTAYSGMGQTWSVPAISFVTAAQNLTTRRPLGVEFVAFTGSGYGAAAEGSTIYALDMQTGDVVRSSNIGDRAGVTYENALAAPAAAFNPKQLRPGFIGNPAGSATTHVYLPDIHGRIWRVLANPPGTPIPTNPPPLLFADAGPDQPFGNAVALVSYEGTGSTPKPHVFAETGNENRIFPPPANTPPFKMFGMRDDDLTVDPNNGVPDQLDGAAWELFTLDFPNGFRGTVQPATAFNDPDPLVPNDESARVFFAGTRFNPPGTANAPPPPPCVSSFDSILFAVGAETGGAAYDLNAAGDDRSIQLNRQRIQAVRVSGGRLVVDTGLNAGSAPPPPAPPTVNPPAPAAGNVLMGGPLNPLDGTPRIPGLVTYKVNSSVCR